MSPDFIAAHLVCADEPRLQGDWEPRVARLLRSQGRETCEVVDWIREELDLVENLSELPAAMEHFEAMLAVECRYQTGMSAEVCLENHVLILGNLNSVTRYAVDGHPLFLENFSHKILNHLKWNILEMAEEYYTP